MDCCRKYFWSDVGYTVLFASFLSGIPSTLLAYLTDRDMLEATRAAALMLATEDSSKLQLALSAIVVHGFLTFFWASVLTLFAPRKHAILVSFLLMIVVGFFNLLVMAPLFFPSIVPLDFWPQMMDHAALGFSFGLVLYWRSERRAKRQQRRAIS